jgi:predicted aspartyl protease
VVIESVPTTRGWTERQVGQIHVSMTIENSFDRQKATERLITADAVRTVQVEGVLVDTGASHLCLPANLVAMLCLPLVEEVPVETAAGVVIRRLVDGARVIIAGRSSTFPCIELAEGSRPLLGVIVMEALGLELDVLGHRLNLAPRTDRQSHFLAY